MARAATGWQGGGVSGYKDVVPSALRVMSYNVRYFGHALRGLASTRRPKRGIAAALAALDPLPSVVCLQEVETASVRANAVFRRARPDHTQLESFMAHLAAAFAARGRALPYDAFYFRAHRYGSARLPLYTTGLAILVDVTRVHVTGHNAGAPENITHHHVARLRNAKQTRICAHVRLDLGAQGPLHVFNTHLSLPTPFARQFWVVKDKMGFGANQLSEARNLSAFIRRAAGDEPFIVCGDFNSPPGSPVYEHLARDVQLSPLHASLGHTDPANPRHFPTAGALGLRMHLDHLFAGNRVTWLDCDGTERWGDARSPFHSFSDHVPLIARCELPR